MTKAEKLAALKERMESDMTLPLRSGATQLVFGTGNPDTQVYFIGEAPGYFEDKEGKPFVGQAGKLLTKLIESIGLSREDVYISNVVRFRPPANRDPLPEEIEAFQPYVDEEIRIIDPKVIVTLGRFSMGKFLPDARISLVHGKPFNVHWDGRDVLVLPMYHPAAALRATGILQQLQEDFKLIKKALDGELEKPSVTLKDEIEEEKEKVDQLNLF